MSTVIEIENGREFAAYDVGEEVCRIGSHPMMTIPIHGLPAHAFTLARQDDHYVVINRGCEDFAVRSRKVAIGHQAEWRIDDRLEVNGAILRLRCGSAQKTDTEPALLADRASEELIETDGPTIKRARLGAIIFLAVSVVYAAAFLVPWQVSHVERSEEYLRRLLAELEKVPLQDLTLQKAERLLRRASIQELREDPQQRVHAREAFTELRTLIQRRQAMPLRREADLESRLLAYVEYRLKYLN